MPASAGIERLIFVPRRFGSSIHGFLAAYVVVGMKTKFPGITDIYATCQRWTNEERMDYVSSLRLPFRSVTLRLAGADILNLGASHSTNRPSGWQRYFARNAWNAVDLMPELQKVMLVGLPTDALRRRYRDAMLSESLHTNTKLEDKTDRKEEK